MTILTQVSTSAHRTWAYLIYNPRQMNQPGAFEEFEATSLFCSRCRRATPARKKLLLVLPTGNKYDYVCGECGAPVGGKTDNDPTDFYRTVRPRSSKP